MASISVKNDKFSANLYKPVLRCSNEVFDTILNKVKSELVKIFTTEQHWTVNVEHSQVSRNILLISLKYDDTIKSTDENDNTIIVTPATYIKKYVLSLNLSTKELLIPSDNLAFGQPSAPYNFMIVAIGEWVGNNANIFNTSTTADETIYESIDNYLNSLENISKSYRIKVVSLNTTYGICKPIVVTNANDKDESKVYTIEKNSENNPTDLENLYAKGTELTIEALPNEHYNFMYWTNKGKNIEENPYTFKVNDSETFAAVFAKEDYIVTLDSDIDIIESNEEKPAFSVLKGTGMYKYQDAVTLMTKPINGFTFVGWYEVDNAEDINLNTTTPISRDLICKFNIDHNMHIVAKFTDELIDLATLPTTEIEDETEEEQLETNPITPNNPTSNEEDTTIDPNE